MTMDVREKLVELLKSVLPNFRNNMAYWGEKPIYEFADCLLAHGVTVQEWIPVTDRLPEIGRSVLPYNAPAKCAAEAMYKGEGSSCSSDGRQDCRSMKSPTGCRCLSCRKENE